MSYLLEALRKSERERQQQTAVPGLQTPTVEWESETRTRSPWLMVAVLAICLNSILLAVLVWRFGFADDRAGTDNLIDQTPAAQVQAVPAPMPTATSQTTATPAVIVVQAPREPTPAIVVRERSDSSRPLTRAPQLPANVAGSSRPLSAADGAFGSSARTGASDHRSLIDERTETVAESTPSVHALPLSVRQQLPLLTMNSHIYASNARDSFVMINGVSLSPGQELSAGLKLIAVVPEGAVLSWHGQQFMLPALASFSP